MAVRQLYVFRWDRPGLPGRKGQICFVRKRGKMNSCEIEFLSDKKRAVVSRNAIRKMRICQVPEVKGPRD